MNLWFTCCFIQNKDEQRQDEYEPYQNTRKEMSLVGFKCFAKVFDVTSEAEVKIAFSMCKDLFHRKVRIHNLGVPEIRKRDQNLEQRFLQQLLLNRIVWIEFISNDIVRMKLDKQSMVSVDHICFKALSTVSPCNEVKGQLI
jgi:hypothetical protein